MFLTNYEAHTIKYMLLWHEEEPPSGTIGACIHHVLHARHVKLNSTDEYTLSRQLKEQGSSEDDMLTEGESSCC